MSLNPEMDSCDDFWIALGSLMRDRDFVYIPSRQDVHDSLQKISMRHFVDNWSSCESVINNWGCLQRKDAEVVSFLHESLVMQSKAIACRTKNGRSVVFNKVTAHVSLPGFRRHVADHDIEYVKTGHANTIDNLVYAPRILLHKDDSPIYSTHEKTLFARNNDNRNFVFRTLNWGGSQKEMHLHTYDDLDIKSMVDQFGGNISRPTALNGNPTNIQYG